MLDERLREENTAGGELAVCIFPLSVIDAVFMSFAWATRQRSSPVNPRQPNDGQLWRHRALDYTERAPTD